MADELYYQHDGQQYGPITGAELKALAAAGKLLPDDLIRKEGMEKWVPARNVKGLFPAVSVPPGASGPHQNQANKKVEDDANPVGKIVPPTRTAKSAGAVEKAPQTEPPEPLPLPEEDDDEQPTRTTHGKVSPLSGFWAKLMGTWHGYGHGTRIGILSGAGAVVVLLILVPVLMLSGGKSPSGTPSSSGTSSGKGDGPISSGDSSSPTPSLKPDEFAERLRKLTRAPRREPATVDGHQAANLFDRPQPLSPKWKKHGPCTFYSIASSDHFRAEEAFRAVGRPDRVLQGPFLSSFIDPPGKDWQEWVWLRNGVTVRCWVTNVSALKDRREELEVRADDEVGISSPGLLIGAGSDF